MQQIAGPLVLAGALWCQPKGTPMNPLARRYTTKQFGDACELLVAAELTFAGIPTMKAPDYWPGYDLIAQPSGALPQRISVKGRTFAKGSAFVGYKKHDVFDWLAVVIVPKDGVGRAEHLSDPPRCV